VVGLTRVVAAYSAARCHRGLGLPERNSGGVTSALVSPTVGEELR
jgi:hypothetical protein